MSVPRVIHCTQFKVFLAAFVLLLLGNSFTLQDPPYWDALTGIFSQAVWLKDHQFDYLQLWQQPKWVEGGPHVKILYLLAPVFALLMDFFEPTWAFTLIHVFNLFCAALTVALFYMVLRDLMPGRYALLWCSAAALDPIWSGQAASLYIEIPQAACYAAVILALHRQRFKLAAVFCLLAFLIKSSALLLALALFVWYGLRYLYGLWRAGPAAGTRSSREGLYTLLPFPALYLLAKWFNADQLTLQGDLSRSGFMLKTLLPYQTLTLVVTATVFVAVLFKPGWRRAVFSDRAVNELLAFLVILVGGFWVAYHLYPLPLCRYATPIIFPMIVLLGLLSARLGSRFTVLLAGLLILSGALNQYGLLMPSLPGQVARSGEHLERSREYLVDLAANRRTCRFLEDNHFEDPISVKYPFAHMLTIPEMGYVQKPFPNIYVAGKKPVFSTARKYGPGVGRRGDNLYLYAPNVFEFYTRPSFFPGPSAEIVYVDTVLDASVILYRYPGGSLQ